VALYCLSSDSQQNPRLRIGAGHSIVTMKAVERLTQLNPWWNHFLLSQKNPGNIRCEKYQTQEETENRCKEKYYRPTTRR